jgi:DNA modification methylase
MKRISTTKSKIPANGSTPRTDQGPPYQNDIEWQPVLGLRPSSNNARTHPARQLKTISRSIAEFGFTNPILIDETGQILAGHGRWKAAQQLGWTSVPTLRITHLSAAQKRAYIIADNQLAAKAGWDRAILRAELQGLEDLDFDLELTGFETSELDIVLADDNDRSILEDTIPAMGKTPACRMGDLWQLGDHLLVCGDATHPEAYRQVLRGQKATFVFADPPYNVRIAGNVSGRGLKKHREFSMASGEMSSEQFVAFLTSVFNLLGSHTVDGAIHAVCMDWRHIGEMMQAGNSAYSELKNLCVWVKSNAGMGSFYRSRHELIFIWKYGRQPHINNFELGQYGRSRSNIWEYNGANAFGTGRAEDIAMHPTCKPVDLVADAILDCSKRGDIVLDPFGGSGSTLIACQKTARVARLIEIDPLYCDVIIRRWEKFTGAEAIHKQSGLTFRRKAEDTKPSSVHKGAANDKKAR